MADVVLKDSSGAEQTYTDVDELEIPNTEDGTERFVSERLIQNQVQANWSQTDQTQPDYIRNKPSIADLPKYAKVASSGNYNDLGCKPYGEITILPEKNIYFTMNDLGIDGLYVNSSVEGEVGVLMQAQDALVPGEQYVVVWDGTEYTLTAGAVNDFAENFDGITYVGNQALFFGGIVGTPTDSGEPFIVLSQYGTVIGIYTDTGEWHTVSVTPVKSIRKIDSKYLPDGLVTADEMARQLAAILPAYSSAGNGKVLGIQNGKLAWVTVQTSGSGLTVNADGDTLVLDGDSITANADGDTIVITTSLPVSTDGDTIILGGT